MDEPLSDQQDSGFEIMDVSLQKSEINIQGQPSEIKENHFDSNPKVVEGSSPKKRPGVIGIKGFQENQDDQPEIDSPMRKKKMGLGQLKISQEVCEKPTDFLNLEKLFQSVLHNFEGKKLEFDDLKKYTKDTLYQMKENGKLVELGKVW